MRPCSRYSVLVVTVIAAVLIVTGFLLERNYGHPFALLKRKTSFSWQSFVWSSKPNSTSEDDLDLRIIAIVYNRAKSLQRLLDSLNGALYFDDDVKLEVWIDRSKDKEQIHEETYQVARNFTFLHGSYEVCNHTHHVGLYGQWLLTWKPRESSSEMAVIFEDDLTVSKYFYQHLKNVHKKYGGFKNVNGFSLQGKSIKHGKSSGLIAAPKEQLVFLYPVLGTWGFSPNKKNWIQFIDWVNVALKNSSFHPLVPGLKPTDWYLGFVNSGREDGMWSMWHIYYAYQNHELTLYPNFPDHQGLAINWQEPGLHYRKSPMQKQGDLLVTRWDSSYDVLPDRPICLDANSKQVKCEDHN